MGPEKKYSKCLTKQSKLTDTDIYRVFIGGWRFGLVLLHYNTISKGKVQISCLTRMRTDESALNKM